MSDKRITCSQCSSIKVLTSEQKTYDTQSRQQGVSFSYALSDTGKQSFQTKMSQSRSFVQCSGCYLLFAQKNNGTRLNIFPFQTISLVLMSSTTNHCHYPSPARTRNLEKDQQTPPFFIEKYQNAPKKWIGRYGTACEPTTLTE